MTTVMHEVSTPAFDFPPSFPHSRSSTHPPPLSRDFGGVSRFSGQVETVKCFENNPLVRQRLTGEDGTGKVLVVDGGGSLRVALMGDQLGVGAVKNGWKVRVDKGYPVHNVKSSCCIGFVFVPAVFLFFSNIIIVSLSSRVTPSSSSIEIINYTVSTTRRTKHYRLPQTSQIIIFHMASFFCANK